MFLIKVKLVKKHKIILKKKFETENKKFEKEASVLKKEEKDLIAKKKIITPEEYKKELNNSLCAAAMRVFSRKTFFYYLVD